MANLCLVHILMCKIPLSCWRYLANYLLLGEFIMLKQLAIVLSVTALIACGEEAVVATETAEAAVVEVVATQETEMAQEAVVTEEVSTEAAMEVAPTEEAAPAQEAVAAGTVEG